MATVSFKLACVVMMCLAVVGAPVALAAITCGQVSSSVVPCIGYVTVGGASPTAPCCAGVKSLNAAAATAADRRTACGCLKTLARTIPGYKDNLAQGLPAKCGVNIPYKISVSTNCASIN